MPSLIDRVRVALKRPASTTEQLAAAVADARQAHADAIAAVEKAQAVVTAGFMDAADKRQSDRDVLARAREAAEDAGLVLAEAERRHAAAVEGEEQSRRRMLYDSAKAEADAAALALSKTYPTLARGMVAMLKDLATAQQAVALVNEQLPDGAAPLVDPEMSARCAAGSPRVVVSDEWIEAWGSVEATVPLSDEYQAGIYDCGNGWGKRGAFDGGSASMGDPKPNFRRRRFRKVTYREAVPGNYPYALACAIRLPSVRGDAMLWGDDFLVHDPALSAAISGRGEPTTVLANIAQLDAAATALPVTVERAVTVEYPEFAEVVAFPPEQPMESRSSKPSGTGSRFGASPFAAPGARAGGRR